MALDKLVDSTQLDSDLTTVANAIRTRGGTSESLAFPTDFASAIAAIPGGTSAGDVVMDEDGYLVLSNEASTTTGLLLIGTAEEEVSTSSTTPTDVTTIQTGVTLNDPSKFILVVIRDKAGERNGYFYGSDEFLCPFMPGFTSTTYMAREMKYISSNGQKGMSSSKYGIYTDEVSGDGDIYIKARYYSTTYGTIDGTYLINVYIGSLPI